MRKWVFKVLEETKEVKPKKTAAHNFNERDYSGVDLMAKLRKKQNGGIEK